MKLSIEPVINLLHSATHSTLATQSTQLPGYPYATVIPNVLDEYHRPLLLVSALAEHTKNLLADPRVSLSVLEPGTANVQTAARMTILGDAEQFEPNSLLKARYLRYLPEAGQYLSLDFMFIRIMPKRIRYIAGVGKMGWFEDDDWRRAPSLSLESEAKLIDRAIAAAPARISILGIDSYGIDFHTHGFRDRHAFDARVGQDFLDDASLKRVVSRLS